MLALAIGAYFLAGRYVSTLAMLGAEARLEFTLWAALGFFGLWVTLPVVIFPLDENLDPAQFAMAPVPPLSFITGLFGVNVAGMPGTTHPDSFAILCGAMIVMGLLLYLILRWIKWF